MLLFAACILYRGLGGYSDSYDSGVYLESARMMARGFAPYRQIFSSQPPLWLPLIYFSFRLFGESFLAGQLVTATGGLIAIVAVMSVANRLGGKAASIIAGALMVLSPLELAWSRTIDADVPSAALAAVGIALAAHYARSGFPRWLAAASAAITCSILIKLFSLFAIPSLLLFVIARWRRVHDLSQRQRLRFIARDFCIIFSIFALITLPSLALFGFDQVWHQAVAFHLAARSDLPPLSLYGRWQTLNRLLAGERLLFVAAPLAPLCLLSGLDGLALFAWPCFTFLLLLDHRPLYDHHMAALIPALAAAIGAGTGHLPIINSWFSRWLSIQPRPLRIAGKTVYAAACLAILAAGAGCAWGEAADQRSFIRRSAVPSPDLTIAAVIAAHTRPGDMIITDAQGIAFLAGRDVPPGLTDTSYTRIGAGYLGPQEVIGQGERYHVRLILLWSGRLSLMPQVVMWALRRFPYRVEFGSGRVLYSLDANISSRQLLAAAEGLTADGGWQALPR